MKKEYFIVYFGEDGITIDVRSKEQVQKMLDSDPDGEYVSKLEERYEADGGPYPIYKTMIIKGDLVVPKPVEIVKKLEI